MTYQEALNYLDNVQIDMKSIESMCETSDLIETCKKALEKQMPKKPKRVDHWTFCPTCYDKYGFSYDILVGMRGLKTGECHCLNCGQAIDWSDE